MNLLLILVTMAFIVVVLYAHIVQEGGIHWFDKKEGLGSYFNCAKCGKRNDLQRTEFEKGDNITCCFCNTEQEYDRSEMEKELPLVRFIRVPEKKQDKSSEIC